MKLFTNSFSIYLAFNCLLSLVVAQFDESYDYYLFQLTWPTTFCSHNDCYMKPPDHFVIHGNWPNRNDHRLLNYCPDERENDLSVLNPISDQLSEYWPALKGGDHRNFWEYEWKKHGTCATESPALFGLQNYFETTMKMFNNLDLDHAIRAMNFIPTRGPRVYPTRRFLESLRKYYKVDPFINCQKGPNGVSYLENISFCFDKNLNLINCPLKLQCSSEFILPSSN